MFSITTMASSTTNPVEIVKRHQRQIVDTVAEQVHHPERANQRNRHHDAGDERRPHIAQETKTTRMTSTMEINKRELDICDGSAYRRCAVHHHTEIHRRRDGSLRWAGEL